MGQGVHLAKWGCRQQEGQAQPRLHLQPPELSNARAPGSHFEHPRNVTFCQNSQHQTCREFKYEPNHIKH